MPVHVIHKLTRPSTDHYFMHELVIPNSPLSEFPVRLLLEFPSNYFETQWIKQYGNFDGFIKSYVDEFISWEEIIARKNELRPDLQKWIEDNHFTIQKILQRSIDNSLIGPLFNPFSLTFTAHFIFDSMEVAINVLRNHKPIWEPKSTDNTMEFYINDVPFDIWSL